MIDALGWVAREKESMRSADFHSLTEAPRLVSYVPRYDDNRYDGRIAQFFT